MSVAWSVAMENDLDKLSKWYQTIDTIVQLFGIKWETETVHYVAMQTIGFNINNLVRICFTNAL